MKKLLPAVLSTLLFVGMLTFAIHQDFNVQTSKSSQTTVSPWPMFQHDPQHTGRSPYTGPGEDPMVTILLGNETVDEHFGFPVIDSHGTLYLTKGTSNDNPSLCAFNADGTQKWSFETPSRALEPILSESTSTVYLLWNNRELCALNMETGSANWQKSYIYIYPAPTVNDDGILYFNALCELPNGTRRTTLIGLNQDGIEVLNFDIGPVCTPDATRPSVDKSGIVYFGFNDTLYAVSPNGAEEWRRKFETIEGEDPLLPHPEVRDTPVIGDDGTVFVVVFGEAGDKDRSVEFLHAIDPNNPTVDKWTRQLNAYVPESPSIDVHGNLYIVTGGMFNTRIRYSLSKIDPTGTLLWREYIELWYSSDYGGPGPLLVDAGNNIYVAKTEMGGRLHIFDETGSQIMVYCGSEDVARELSLAADGTLYVASDEHVYAVKSTAPQEIGLLVTITTINAGPYYIGDIINFEITVINPTDLTGINLQANDVRVTIVEPAEIDVEASWQGVTYTSIAPGESKSTSFEAEATTAGENIRLKSNTVGATSIGVISGSMDYYFTIHDPATPRPDWSFVVITDLHIGYYYKDYGAEGFDDDNTGQNYSLTRILESAVETIIFEKDYYNIRFVAVLGDISDTAEESEFLKAREILNRLNDPDGNGNIDDGIPYIPLIGNHDTCPYTQKYNYEDRPKWPWEYQAGHDNVGTIAAYGGDKIFQQVFWDTNPDNCELINSVFGLSWIKQICPTQHFIAPEIQNLYIENYALNCGGINFICIDVTERAYPPWYPVSSAITSVPIWEETKEFLENHVEDFQAEPIILLSHFPLNVFGGFFQNQYLAELLVEKGYSNDSAYTFGGHTHRNVERIQWLLDWKSDPVEPAYWVIETEALSQIELEWDIAGIHIGESTHTGQSIRIVQVKDGNIDYSTILNPPIQSNILSPPPSFSYTYASLPEPNEEVTFTACFTKYHGFNTSFQWDFGDGHSASGASTTHTYLQEGDYNAILTVTTRNLVTEEETNQIVTRRICVRSKHLLSSLPPDLQISSIITEEDLTQVPKNVLESAFIMKNVSQEMILIAMVDVDFAEVDEDINISAMVADVDIQEGKSIIYMSSWPEEIGQNRLLFIPSTGTGTVFVCLNATSLDEVNSGNHNLTINVGDTKEGITVTTSFYNGREYYVVSGVTGTGGGETILGDINADRTVDIFDAITLANAFDKPPGDPGWNPNADINGDQTVYIFDAIILANNFGNTWP